MKNTSRSACGLLDYVAGVVLLLFLGLLVPREQAENMHAFPDAVRAATFHPEATYTAHRGPVGSTLPPRSGG